MTLDYPRLEVIELDGVNVGPRCWQREGLQAQGPGGGTGANSTSNSDSGTGIDSAS